MIIRTEFIQLGGQAAHLSRTDTNKQVVVRYDLARLAPHGLLEATRAFAAITRSNPRTVRDLIHTKISPAHPLTDAELTRTLDMIEAELGIPKTMPRIVVEHDKGDRARHFHIIWPVVDPDTGRAIKSNENYFKDELVSRRLELAFGEAVTPGPRQLDVVEELRRRDRSDEAEVLSALGPVDAGARLGGRTRQQAARLGVNLNAFAETVHKCWVDSKGDHRRFGAALERQGLRIANGDNAILVLDDATGFPAPLARLLRQVGKDKRAPIHIKERDLQIAFGDAAEYSAARDAGLAEALAKANKGVETELERMAAEAAMDGEIDLAKRLNRARLRKKERRRAELRQPLKARRRQIADQYRRRDRIRRARVGRAFRAAKWAASPAIRNLAFLAGAGAMALAGGGLGLALVAVAVAVAMLPSFERARALAALARHEQGRDVAHKQKECDDAFSLVVAEQGRKGAPLDFGAIPKATRGAAGFVAHCAIRSIDRPLDGVDETRLAAATQALGAESAETIRRAALDGPTGGALRILSWYKWSDPGSEKALATAFGHKVEERVEAPIPGPEAPKQNARVSGHPPRTAKRRRRPTERDGPEL
jgi:hypothetical protein